MAAFQISAPVGLAGLVTVCVGAATMQRRVPSAWVRACARATLAAAPLAFLFGLGGLAGADREWALILLAVPTVMLYTVSGLLSADERGTPAGPVAP